MKQKSKFNFLFILCATTFFLGACGGGGLQEKPVFTLMDSSETGFFFWNEVYDKPELNALNYGYFYNGGGVAVGDINNDDLPDVYMVGNTFGGRLYVNDGNLKFHQITNTSNTATDGFTHGVTMADVNQDGYLDIYLSRSMASIDTQRANRLLINNGKGTFTNQAKEYGIDDMGFSTHANFFDYDNDGDPDLYVLNHSINYELAMGLITKEQREKNLRELSDADYTATVSKLYRNNGNGTFTDVTAQAGLKDVFFGLSATASDVNNDGWLDLYCTSDFADRDHLYINNKNGTFTDKIHEAMGHISQNSMGSDIADFNNDGALDILTLDMMAEDNYRHKQLKGNNPYDLFQMGMEYGYHCQVMRNCLQLNNGDGTYSEIGQLAGVSHTDWSWSPLFADFDNDGRKDLFVSNGYKQDITDMDYMKYGSNEIIRKAGGKMNVQPMDLLAGTQSTPTTNYIYRNAGNLTYENKSKDWGLAKKSFSNGAAYADLDLDGDLDLLVNNFGEPSFLYRNNTIENQPDNQFISFTFDPKQHSKVQGTKITLLTDSGQQFQQLINNRGFLSTVHQVLHFGLGKNNAVSEVQIVYPNGTIQKMSKPRLNTHIRLDMADGIVGSFDKEENKKMLLAEIPNPFSPIVQHTESDFIDFKDEPLLEQMYSNRGPYAAAGDVNGDGLDDIYFGASAGYEGKLYLQTSAARFQQKMTTDFKKDKACEDGRSVLFDADKDGDLDLYVSSGSNEVRDTNLFIDRLYLNDGSGAFTRAVGNIPSIAINAVAVAVLDIDSDGDYDLVVGGNVKPKMFPNAFNSYCLINDGAGNFTANYHLLPQKGALGIINDIAIGDLNADGEKDIVLAGDWRPIGVLLNSGGQFTDQTEEYGLSKTSGMWNTVKIIDLNADGKKDIVGGNRGTNNFFKTSAKQPATMYVNDFDENGEQEAIVNYYFSDGVLYPKYSLNELLEQLPSWRGIFSRYSKYSAARSDEIFSEKKYPNTETYECHTFHSTAFIREGHEFQSHRLPQRAQFSPTYGIAAIKTVSSAPYVFTVGNNYEVDVNTARYDASYGTLSNWKTNGLETLSSYTIPSVSGQARQILQLRSQIGDNNKTFFLVIRNGQTPVLYGLKNSEADLY